MLGFCREIRPQVIVAALGGAAFDFLRFAPAGCMRVAMIQSDDVQVYNQVIRYAPWIDVVVGVSKEICRKASEAVDLMKTKVSYQPYGVPMPEAPAPPTRESSLRVLYLGRLCEEQKRVSLMARIIRESLESSFPIKWTIAGDGHEFSGLQKSFADHPERVTFLGEIPYLQVPGLFAQNDVYFLCSDYEGLPLSLLEAMGAGLVPVVSDLPSGISEVVNSRNGIRVPINYEAGYLKALLRLATERNSLDDMAGQSIIAVRENFSIEAMTRRWLAMMNAGSSGSAVDWSSPISPTAPLELQGKLLYRPVFKPLRRIFKKAIR
jgi:glycosyltransferase involved in cell wall biosynthesis